MKVFQKICIQNKFRQTHRNSCSYNWPSSTLHFRFSQRCYSSRAPSVPMHLGL